MKSIVLCDGSRPKYSDTVCFFVDVMMRSVCVAEARATDPSTRATSSTIARIDVPILEHLSVFTGAYESTFERLDRDARTTRRLVVWHLDGGTAGKGLAQATASYEALCSMLILTFPEVLFIRVESFADLVNGMNLLASGYDPTFDGLGVRSRLREECRKADPEEFSYLASRKEVAVAVDDEEAYAILHAYIAYRIGYRAVSITSNAMASLFIEPKGQYYEHIGRKATLTLEDISIRFSDQQKESASTTPSGQDEAEASTSRTSSSQIILNDSLASLRSRTKLWPFDGAITRLFVTSDHSGKYAQDNSAFINELNRKADRVLKEHFKAVKVDKPHAGVFRLWMTISRTLTTVFHHIKAKPDERGHSSPGVLRLVAERLVQRAGNVDVTAPTMRGIVVGAVIATDAHELLGERTPTLAIEALRLKHQFEVMAECQFSGVEYHMPVKWRLKEIETQVERICKWFGDGKREEPALNAMMAICSALVREFKRYGQYEEEQGCMQVVRRCHFKLWTMQTHLTGLLAWPLKYVEFLLGSFVAFGVSVAAIFLLFCIHLLLFSDAGSFLCAAQGALIAFFTAGKPEGFFASCKLLELPGSIYVFGFEVASAYLFGLGVALAIVLAYVHLAVFVAHLYTSVNRR